MSEIVLYKDIVKYIDESYDKLSILMQPYLTMIKLTNCEKNLKIYSDARCTGFVSGISVREIIEDCEKLSREIQLNDEIKQLENYYYDLMFPNHKLYNKDWQMCKLLDNNVYAFICLITCDKTAYYQTIDHITKNCWDYLPCECEYELLYGTDLLNKTYVDADDTRLNRPLGADVYKIKKTKWYILRKYIRYMPYRENEDLSYKVNVFEKGIGTRKEALETLEKLKTEPVNLYFKESSAYLTYVNFYLFGQKVV